jgi:hypothetical protein
MTRPRGATILALSIALSLASLARAKPICHGPLKKSCLRKLYKCLNAKGACTTGTQVDAMTMTFATTSCWSNGAKVVLDFDALTQMGRDTGTNSKGAICFTGAITTGGGTLPGGQLGGNTTTLMHKNETWTLIVDLSGNLHVTCPNGKREAYSPVQLQAAGSRCGGTGGCNMGTCP